MGKKLEGKKCSFMIVSYKMTCFYPCHSLPWYVSISILAFFCPPFFLLTGKDKRHETFPHFFHLWQGLWRQVGERCCHFSATTNQQNITTSLHHRNRLSLKGLNSSSIFFETLAMNAVKGHQEHNTVLLLKLENLIVSILFFLIYSTFPFLF